MSKIKKRLKDICVIAITSILLFIVIFAVNKKTGSGGIIAHSAYDSYTLQAMSWREGRADLAQNYPWLELAVLNDTYFKNHPEHDPDSYIDYFYDDNNNFIEYDENRYYVSFPPFPSVPMYLLTFIFGNETPSNLIGILYGIGALIFAILLCRRFKLPYVYSICGGVLLTVASSSFFLISGGMSGSVWFMAQLLSLFLTTAAFYFIHGDKTRDYYIAFVLLGFAVGCRPFQLLYYFYFAYLVLKKYNFKFFKTIKFYIPAAAIGVCYMIYNYIRFGNVLEFGHNYLPEMMRAPEGQFSLYYITVNYRDMFLTLPKIVDNKLEFSSFSFACWICNVLFIILVISILIRLKSSTSHTKGRATELNVNKKESCTIELIILCVLIIIHFIVTMMHKTLGAFQFGSRYTVDILPAALVAVAYLIKPIINSDKKSEKCVFNYLSSVLIIGSSILNVTAAYKYLNEGKFVYSLKSVHNFEICIMISFFIFEIIVCFNLIKNRLIKSNN